MGRGRGTETSLPSLSPPPIDHATCDLVLAAGGAHRQQTRFHFLDNLLLESSFKFPSLFPHRSTPSAGPSYPLVEPITPPSNSQIFSPVNGAQSKASKELLLSSEFRPLRNWEIHQAYVPGINFIDGSYLTAKPSDDDLKIWRDFFKAAGVKENPDNGVEEFAINFALEKLKSRYNNVQLVEKLNYGFDIQAETSDGVPIRVEVKGISSEQDVELTGNEADAADTYKSSFYLGVVASIPNAPTIYLVNNPAIVGKKDKLTIPVDVWKVSESI